MVDVKAQESTVVDFSAFDSQRDALSASGVVLKKDTAPSVDLEPEYIAVAEGKAYVTLQENNAIAVLDVASKTFEGVYPIGFEDYGKTPIDIDKKDDAYAPKTYEGLLGIRMPDAIAAYTLEGKTYLVTANEGDAREWGDEDAGTFYLNEEEVDFGDEGAASPAGSITGESGLTGKVVFFKSEDFDGLDGTKDYLFGGRTFTIFQMTEEGLREVFTSGGDFESLTAKYVPDYYNTSNDNAVLDDRSGKKGPEPESVTVGAVNGKTYAFVALERTGGIMVYDVTDPKNTAFVNYINTRDFDDIVKGSEQYEDGELDKWVTGGDVAPEGLLFLDEEKSPNGEPLLLAACEVSGTVAVYQMGDETLTVLPFADVEEGKWYVDAVQYAYKNSLMEGTSGTAFEPETNLSRAMPYRSSITWKASRIFPRKIWRPPYTDVDGKAWYTEAVYWARLHKVAEGDGDGTFRPGDEISREEFAQMLYNYARYKGCDLTAKGDLSQFPDGGQVAGWAKDAMAWANGNGLINGHDDGALDPAGTTTRAQAAAILMRFDQNLVQH